MRPRTALSNFSERHVEDACLPGRVLPLDEDRALVCALDDPGGALLTVGYEQADRAAHPEEARRWDGQGARDDLLHDRAAQAERVEPLIEDADEIVLCVAERLGGHGARV